MDLAFFKPDGRRAKLQGIDNALLLEAGASDKTAEDTLEIICGKVVKYLLTSRGSDAFDPMYGGRALHRTHIAPSLIGEIRLELEEDLRDCTAYLKSAENRRKDPRSERLAGISLAELIYDRKAAPGALHVRLLIKTTRGNTAVIRVL